MNCFKRIKPKTKSNRIAWLIDTGAGIGLTIGLYYALKGIALLYFLIKGWLWIEGLK